ncbi:LOW QUALITY PROTEIN: immunoglobulin superfamily member 22 [Morus bassanus]
MSIQGQVLTEVVSRKSPALLESFSMDSFEVLAGESIPEFVEKPCPLATPGDNYKCIVSNTHTDAIYTVSLIMTKELKPLKVTERQTAVFEICLPKKVQNFTKFNGKELEQDKYEIITSEDGLAHTMKIKRVLSGDFKELSVETGDLGFPIQFVSNLKNTQVKEKGKASECVLTSEDVILKGMENGQVIERSPEYIMKHEGKRAELIINAAELSDSGECTMIAGALVTDSSFPTQSSGSDTNITDICNHEEYVCDVHALTGDPAELHAVLNDMKVEGMWLNDDSPVIEESVLKLFAAHIVTVKAKQSKVPFKAKPVPKVTWFKDGIEVTEEVVLEKASDVLLTIKTCVKEDSEAVMLNLKNYCGSASDNPYLNFVRYDPLNNSPPCHLVSCSHCRQTKPPQGKAEFLNTWGKCKMRWKVPKGNGGKQVTHFISKRRMAGKKSWIKVGVVESNYPTFATEVEEGEAYFGTCAINSEGLIKPLETEETFAGEPKPAGFNVVSQSLFPSVSQSQVVDVGKEDVTITWNFPAQDGGSQVQGYVIEKRKKSSSLCVPVTKEPVQGTRFKVDGFLEDIDEFHVIAVNHAGPGLLSMCSTSHCKGSHHSSAVTEPPGLLKVVDFSNSSISLAWQEPDQGDVLSGYILEMAEDTKKWTKCTKIPISSTTYTLRGLQERQILLLNQAVNEAGVGEAAELQEGIHFPPPTNLQLVEEVPNTVTLNHSSDVDDQTDYGVLKYDVSTATWFTAAEKVYSNKYTITGLLPGRKYFVIVCNDTGDTDPLDSQEQWYISKDRECFDFRMEYPRKNCASSFITPLKNHTSHGNDCAMSCAFISTPHPTVTLYKGSISITSKSKWFNSTSSICLLTIPTTCSCKLIICDKDLAPENLSDLRKATKGASMDKRTEKYPGRLLS